MNIPKFGAQFRYTAPLGSQPNPVTVVRIANIYKNNGDDAIIITADKTPYEGTTDATVVEYTETDTDEWGIDGPIKKHPVVLTGNDATEFVINREVHRRVGQADAYVESTYKRPDIQNVELREDGVIEDNS